MHMLFCMIQMRLFKNLLGPGLANSLQQLPPLVEYEWDVSVGENIAVRRFARYTLGEGLAKKEENFAEEIAKATGGQ